MFAPRPRGQSIQRWRSGSSHKIVLNYVYRIVDATRRCDIVILLKINYRNYKGNITRLLPFYLSVII